MFTKAISDNNFKAIHFMIDADDCILKKHMQSVIDENQALIRHIVDIISENPEAEIHVGRTGSLRSSVRMDEEMTCQNKTKYTYSEAINQIVEDVKFRIDRIIIIDDYTISHTVNNIPEGTPVAELNWRQDCFRDKSKVISLYGTSHRSASKVDGKVKIHSYDDDTKILGGWNNFFNKQEKHVLLPSQVDVSCHNYRKGSFIQRDMYRIKGTGETNRNYHQGIKQLALLTDTLPSSWFSCYTKMHVADSLAKREAKEILETINSKLAPLTSEEQRLICDTLDQCIAKGKTVFAAQAKMLRDAIAVAKSSQEVDELIYRELSLFVEPRNAVHVISQKIVHPLSQEDEYYRSIETIVALIKNRPLVKAAEVVAAKEDQDKTSIDDSMQKATALLPVVQRTSEHKDATKDTLSLSSTQISDALVKVTTSSTATPATVDKTVQSGDAKPDPTPEKSTREALAIDLSPSSSDRLKFFQGKTTANKTNTDKIILKSSNKF